MAENSSSPKESNPYYFDSSTHICIQYFYGLISEETLWKELENIKLKNVVSRKLTTDPKGKPCYRAILNFTDQNSAKFAIVKLKGKIICGNVVEAFSISEFISSMKNIDETIKPSSRPRCAKVFVSGLKKKTEYMELLKMFSQFQSINDTDIMRNSKGESMGCAAIKFKEISEAFEAEFAFHGKIVGKKMMSLSMRRNDAQMVSVPFHILTTFIKRQCKDKCTTSCVSTKNLLKIADTPAKLPKLESDHFDSQCLDSSRMETTDGQDERNSQTPKCPRSEDLFDLQRSLYRDSDLVKMYDDTSIKIVRESTLSRVVNDCSLSISNMCQEPEGGVSDKDFTTIGKGSSTDQSSEDRSMPYDLSISNSCPILNQQGDVSDSENGGKESVMNQSFKDTPMA